MKSIFSSSMVVLLLCTGCGTGLQKFDGYQAAGNEDSVYFNGMHISDTSDATLLRALFGQSFQRKGIPTGISGIVNQPTTRLEPYPPDTTLANIYRRMYYSEEDQKKQLVIVTLTSTTGFTHTYDGFLFMLLTGNETGYVVNSVFCNYGASNETTFTLSVTKEGKRVLEQFYSHQWYGEKIEPHVVDEIKGNGFYRIPGQSASTHVNTILSGRLKEPTVLF